MPSKTVGVMGRSAGKHDLVGTNPGKGWYESCAVERPVKVSSCDPVCCLGMNDLRFATDHSLYASRWVVEIGCIQSVGLYSATGRHDVGRLFPGNDWYESCIVERVSKTDAEMGRSSCGFLALARLIGQAL